MLISEIIKELEELKKEYGDIECVDEYCDKVKIYIDFLKKENKLFLEIK